MTPPRPTFLDRLLEAVVGPSAEVVLGDLEEEWPERVAGTGRVRATWWYTRSAVETMCTVLVRGGRMMGGRNVETSGTRSTADLWYEARALGRTPMWTSLAVGTVTVGTVFAAVVFSLAEAVRTELVPFPEADRLVLVEESNGQFAAVADPTLRALQERSDVFERVAAWTGPQDANLVRAGGDPVVARMGQVLPGSFELLGYAPTAGRALVREDEDIGGPVSALLSYDFWVREYGASPDALESSIDLNGRTFTVVGVMEADARLPGQGAEGPDVFIPILRLPALATDPGLRYQVLVRGTPGADAATLRAAADQVMEDLRATLPQWRSDPSWHMEVRPLRATLEGDSAQAIRALLGGAALLLALAGANLVALTLARLQGRTREFQIHTALGAPPSIAVRRLLAQNGLVSVAGAALAATGAAWLIEAIRTADPEWIPGAEFASLSPGVLSATALVAIGLGLIVALAASRLHPRMGSGFAGLRSQGPDRRWKAMARGLVLLETGMVVSLAVGAGLVVRSLANLRSVDVGLRLENRLVARANLTSPAYSNSESVRRFTDDVLSQVAGLAGVEAVAASTSAPFSRAGWNFVILEGRDPADGQLPSSELEEVTPGYFEALDLPVVDGRSLEPADYGAGAEKVVVVNEALAALYDGPAVGRTLNYTDGPTLRVVGVVRNSPAGRLDEQPGPRVYLPDMDDAFPWTMRTRWFVVRLSDERRADAIGEALRAAVVRADPGIPLHPPRMLTDMRADLLADADFRSLIFGLLGSVALLLGAAGIYGVVAHTLGAARRETGIRLALGASRARVFARTVAAEAGAVGVGTVLGVLAAWQFASLLAGFLFGVSPLEPMVYVGAVAAVGLVATLAIVLPAYRSSSADPLDALREE